MGEKIGASRYNKRYKEILVIAIPKYLKEQDAKRSQKRIARWSVVIRKKGINIGKLKKENVKYVKRKTEQ